MKIKDYFLKRKLQNKNGNDYLKIERTILDDSLDFKSFQINNVEDLKRFKDEFYKLNTRLTKVFEKYGEAAEFKIIENMADYNRFINRKIIVNENFINYPEHFGRDYEILNSDNISCENWNIFTGKLIKSFEKEYEVQKDMQDGIISIKIQNQMLERIYSYRDFLRKKENVNRMASDFLSDVQANYTSLIDYEILSQHNVNELKEVKLELNDYLTEIKANKEHIGSDDYEKVMQLGEMVNNVLENKIAEKDGTFPTYKIDKPRFF